MTAEPLNSPAEPENGCIASCWYDHPVVAAADVVSDGQRRHHHHSVTSPVKGDCDADPWLLPQFDNDDSPRWNGMSLLIRYWQRYAAVKWNKKLSYRGETARQLCTSL